MVKDFEEVAPAWFCEGRWPAVLLAAQVGTVESVAAGVSSDSMKWRILGRGLPGWRPPRWVLEASPLLAWGEGVACWVATAAAVAAGCFVAAVIAAAVVVVRDTAGAEPEHQGLSPVKYPEADAS